MGSLRKDVDVGRNPEEPYATTLPKLAVSLVMRICVSSTWSKMELKRVNVTQYVDTGQGP